MCELKFNYYSGSLSQFYHIFVCVDRCMQTIVDMLFINKTFQDLVQKMLHVDPSRRLSATQVLNHTWIAQREELSDRQLVLNGPQLKVRVSDCC